MAVLSPVINTTLLNNKPASAAPAAPAAPAPTPYKSTAIKPTIDSSKIGYTSPENNFSTKNLDTGLLGYNQTAGNNLTFDGREIDASAVGANIKQTTPDFAKASNFLTDGAFVENRMNGLLEDPYSLTMQRARAQGMADAGARGLQNTTMGTTIGQSVMADKALDIARPDAATQAQGDLSRQGATYASQRSIQDASQQGSLAEQAAKVNSALSAQNAGQSWDSTKQKAVLEGSLNEQNAAIQGAQTTQQAQYDDQARTQQGLLEGAATTQKANVSGELAGLESVAQQNLSKQEAGQQTALTNLQGNIASNLSKQGATQDKALSTLQSSQAQQLANLQAKLTAARDVKQNEYVVNLAKMGYDQAQSQAMASVIANQSTALINNITGLLNNTDIVMSDNVTKWLTEFSNAGVESIANLFSLDIKV